MNLEKGLLSQVRAFLAPFIGALLSGWLAGGLVVAQAYILSLVIARVFISGAELAAVRAPLAWLTLILLLRAAFTFLQQLSARRLGSGIRSRLRTMLLDRVIDLGPLQLPQHSSGELTTLAMQGIDSLDAYYSQYIPQLILAAAVPLTILITVLPLDLLSAVILIVTAPLIPLFMILIGRSAEAATRRQWRTLQRMGGYFFDTIQGLATLKLYGAARESKKIAAASEKYRQVTLIVLRITFLSALALELVATISTAIVAVQIGLRLLYGGLQFQPALFLLIVAPEFYLPLRTLGLRFHAGATAAAVARDLWDILRIENPTPAPALCLTGLPVSAGNALRFDRVTFTYPHRTVPALKEVSFEVPPNTITALIGANGSGKSTLFNLLLRFIQQQSGAIQASGQAIESFSAAEWRRLIAWVPQFPFLFNASFAENIHMGLNASMDRVRWAAAEAGLHDFICALRDGYATPIGERGHRLSSGQAQRLALARAFYRETPYLLLDEPTAFMDPESAAHLRDTFRRLSVSRTTLLIAHHAATLALARQAVLLHQGRVVAVGPSGRVLEAYRDLQAEERQPTL